MIKQDDMVQVHPVDKDDNTWTRWMRKKLDGATGKVKRILTFGSNGKVFEVEGLTSTKEVPYWFTKEHITKVEE